MGVEYDIQSFKREIENMQVGLANLSEKVNKADREELHVEDPVERSNLNPGTKETQAQKDAREKYEADAKAYNEKMKTAPIVQEPTPPSPPLSGPLVYPHAPDAKEAGKEAEKRAAAEKAKGTAPKTPTEEATASQGAVTTKTVR